MGEVEPSDLRSRQALVALVVAAVIGVVCAVVLVGLVGVAHLGEQLVWDDLRGALDVAPLPVFGTAVLVVAGAVVGLVLRFAPGGGGPDPATHALLDGAPPALSAVPGIVAALVVGLASGASLGPEAPVLGVVMAVVAWAAVRVGRDPGPLTQVALIATVAALFASPVAVLIVLEVLPLAGRALWQRLVPLVAAGAAASGTVVLIAGKPLLDAGFPAGRTPRPVDALSAIAIGILAAAVGLVIARLHHVVRHHSYARLPDPVARLAVAGLVLGLLAWWGGELTLFSGQHEIHELARVATTLSAGTLAVLVLAKGLSVIVAIGAGFRGGSIFPLIMTAAALGALVHAVVPSIPLALAEACAIAGLMVAVQRLVVFAIFMTATTVGIETLPFVCIAAVAAYVASVGLPVFTASAGDAPDAATPARAPGEAG